MDHITVPKNCMCSGHYMFSHLSRYQNESKQPWWSLALRRECVTEALCISLLFIIYPILFFYFLFIFLLKKFQPQIVLILFLFFERFQPLCSY